MTDLMKDLIEKEKKVLKHKLEDYWIDIEQLNREDSERINYPTQKPER